MTGLNTHKRLSFIVHMTPIGKARARTVRRGDKVASYTPHETVVAEATIKQAFVRAWPGVAVVFRKPEAVCCEIWAYLERPKSCPKKRLLPVVKPDVDNIAKLVLDALKGLAYDDDSQVTGVTCVKRYRTPGTPECLSITVRGDAL